MQNPFKTIAVATPAPPAPAPVPVSPPVRYRFLDALRGVALCGILFVNLRDLLDPWITDFTHPVLRFYDIGVQGRFVPVFVFLFGVSAWLLYNATRRRMPAAGARVLMARRFACLLPIGLLNMVALYSGDILTQYSVTALLLLVPATFLPRGPVLAVGLVGTVAAYWMFGNSPLTAVALMITGFAAAQYGLPAWLESVTARARGLATSIFALSAAAGTALAVRQADLLVSGRAADTPSYERVAGFAGVLLAVAFVTGLSLAWRSGGGRAVLDRIFTPLGRTALTNYLAASALVQIPLHALGQWTLPSLWLLPVITVGILALQWVCSVLWLRVFHYGPVEWAWRCATRWERVPMLRR
ncbi:DUF418 domain-containing protein [uncultured Corynebacterium sp.]|uniref:DUF418 domain-containing protein n=1 Tax=uncultured Corynebacterium sp. TaxID=159447 RepID=UPI0025CBD6A2|nr:DUF418 domain-containing protein [uncultured Corynebacterium sp.]